MQHKSTKATRAATAGAIPKAEKSNLEDYNMQCAKRIVASLFLAAALAGPMAAMAFPAPAGAEVYVRVYDRNHRDYHNWDGRENHAWGVYLTNNHRRNYEYRRANRNEQQRYWAWRHSHPRY
jgi:hypothetical protein